MFNINYIFKHIFIYLGIRELRVWSREGCLVSTAERVSGLESSLSWRPSGNLIASTQRHLDKHEVIFFERNGLRHGEFSLRAMKTQFKVVRIMWNIDSTILAVWLKDVKDNPSSEQDNLTLHDHGFLQFNCGIAVIITGS